MIVSYPMWRSQRTAASTSRIASSKIAWPKSWPTLAIRVSSTSTGKPARASGAG